MTNPHTPQNENQDDALLIAIERMEAHLADLLSQNNQLLLALLSNLRENGAPPVRPAAAPAPVGGNRWLEEWTAIVNHAFLQETTEEVQNELRAALAQRSIPLVVIDFDDIGESQRDRSYALFSENPAGFCFVLPSPNQDDEYAAFPYPASETWFLTGKTGVAALYEIQGTDRDYAPKLRITKPASVLPTGAINARGNLVFQPFCRGEVVAR